MPHDPRKYLFDIQRAVDLLSRFTAGRSFEDYEADPMLRSAVERQFEIVGEAMGKLLKGYPGIGSAITDHRKIIAFRNILIHGYDVVSNEVVWGVVLGNLPTLAEEVQALLLQVEPPGETAQDA